MEPILQQILIPTATAFLGYLCAWMFNRHRERREDRGLDKENTAKDITNIDAAIDTWQKVVNALESQVSKLLKQRQEDSRQISELSREVCDLRRQVSDLQSQLVTQAEYQAKIERYERLLAKHGIAY